MLRVLIADDHPVVRRGVRSVLQEAGGFEEPHEAATWEETLEAVQIYQPDVVVMNTTLLDANSLQVLQALKRAHPSLPVVLYHSEPDVEFAYLALAHGANGVVTKAGKETELVKAIHTAVQAGIYLCPVLAARMNGASRYGPI